MPARRARSPAIPPGGLDFCRAPGPPAHRPAAPAQLDCRRIFFVSVIHPPFSHYAIDLSILNRSKCRRGDNSSPPPVLLQASSRPPPVLLQASSSPPNPPPLSNTANSYHQTAKLPIPDALACPRTRRNTPAGISIPPKSSWGILREIPPPTEY